MCPTSASEPAVVGMRSAGVDVVLDQDRNAVQGTAHTARFPFLVERTRISGSVGIDGQDAVQGRAFAIDCFDPLQVGRDEGLRGDPARSQVFLERGD